MNDITTMTEAQLDDLSRAISGYVRNRQGATLAELCEAHSLTTSHGRIVMRRLWNYQMIAQRWDKTAQVWRHHTMPVA
jgi:hypothetical protein